jgi:hypothetical protein
MVMWESYQTMHRARRFDETQVRSDTITVAQAV